MQNTGSAAAVALLPSLFGDNKSIYDQFVRFHRQHPKVYELFKAFSLQLIKKGKTTLGAKMIIERIRWEMETGSHDEAGFKINNNYTAHYARLFMQEHKEYTGYFETREIKVL